VGERSSTSGHHPGTSVSGDVPQVELVGGALANLVSASCVLTSSSQGRMAIVGGPAVLCRLNEAYRATTDLDSALGGINKARLARGLQSKNPGRVDFGDDSTLRIDGIEVDILETVSVDDDELVDLPPLSQLFIVSHCWALETASAVSVRVGQHAEASELPIATPAALVAMKLHSIQDRREEQARKRGSDAEDLYRLLQAHDRNAEIASAILAGPARLAQLVADAAVTVLIDGATRTRRDLVVYGSESGAHIDVESIRLVGERLVDGLR
jgi:hypothetical protein